MLIIINFIIIIIIIINVAILAQVQMKGCQMNEYKCIYLYMSSILALWIKQMILTHLLEQTEGRPQKKNMTMWSLNDYYHRHRHRHYPNLNLYTIYITCILMKDE